MGETAHEIRFLAVLRAPVHLFLSDSIQQMHHQIHWILSDFYRQPEESILTNLHSPFQHTKSELP